LALNQQKQKQRDDLRRSYVFDRQSLKAAAEFHGIPYPTASRWKKDLAKQGDCWDKARSASRLAAGGVGDLSMQVLEDFTLQYQSLMDQIKADEEIKPMDKANLLTKLADSYVKITKAVGGDDQKIGRLSVAMETLELLAKFIGERFPHNLEAFVLVLEQFAPELSKQYG